MMRASGEFPDDENGDVLRRMQAGGDDFTKARDIDFSVIFPSEVAAQDFADHLRQVGVRVTVHCWEGECELPWDVTVTYSMLPAHAAICDTEEALEVAAAPLGGRNDGWGCFRQPVQQ